MRSFLNSFKASVTKKNYLTTYSMSGFGWHLPVKDGEQNPFLTHTTEHPSGGASSEQEFKIYRKKGVKNGKVYTAQVAVTAGSLAGGYEEVSEGAFREVGVGSGTSESESIFTNDPNGTPSAVAPKGLKVHLSTLLRGDKELEKMVREGIILSGKARQQFEEYGSVGVTIRKGDDGDELGDINSTVGQGLDQIVNLGASSEM